MDGYAVRDADLPGRLTLAGESRPGPAGPPALGAGRCVRIFTGAPLPDGADRVVMQEDVRRDGDGGGLRHARRGAPYPQARLRFPGP